MDLREEINRRRTFAVVSHPDAGKTTLTEKLLLFGGAIRIAGAVKSNKIKKTATSDFMEIERQRGISVATSVMGFDYEGIKINILDTPGHQDFAEDTFRTLTAADSVIVVIDVAKGVEIQTEKLVKVCRMRKTPVMVFINKLDREGKDPFELLDEIEEKLGLTVNPLSWNIGMGQNLRGIYNIHNSTLNLFTGQDKQTAEEPEKIDDINTTDFEEKVGKRYAETLREELELISGVYPKFDIEAYRNAEISPVFFGSALYNFGIKEILDSFIKIAPPPQPRQSSERLVKPEEEKFSGFIFKIHANMDPNHRNRLAFVKVVSGVFRRNTYYYHVLNKKKLKFSNPTAFMASKKSVIEEAYPGDIVGLNDAGNFKIGDTLTEGEVLEYKGLPSFSPEMFRYVENADPMKSKQLAKGIDQLLDEGVAQLFTKLSNGRKIIGTVGALQYEVIEYRLEHEYSAKVRFEPLNMYKAAWVTGDYEKIADLRKRKHQYMAEDKHGRNVFMAETMYALQIVQDNYPELKFHFTSEFSD